MSTMDERLNVLLESRRRFLAFLERRLGRADAEDVLQHGLLVALRRMEDLRSDESLVAWFYQVLRNLATDQLRRRTTAATAISEFARGEPTHQAPDDELFAATCACLYDVLPLLKPQHAELLRRVDLSGERLDAVAAGLGIGRHVAEMRLHRARRGLRRRLEALCRGCAKHGFYDCRCARSSPPQP